MGRYIAVWGVALARGAQEVAAERSLRIGRPLICQSRHVLLIRSQSVLLSSAIGRLRQAAHKVRAWCCLLRIYMPVIDRSLGKQVGEQVTAFLPSPAKVEASLTMAKQVSHIQML